MSAKTRIVVLHMKKLVFAGVITGLGIYPACDLPWNPARQFPQTVRRQRSGGNHVRSGCLYLFCHD